MSERLSIVISRKLKKKLDQFKKRVHLDQSALVRQLLEKGLAERMLEHAIEEYQVGHISLGKAVELAETDYWTFLDILSQRHIPYLLDEEDQIEEIEAVRTGNYKKHLAFESK